MTAKPASKLTAKPGKQPQNPSEHAEKERGRIEQREDSVVVNSDESFPASDPPSWTGMTGMTGERHR